MATPEEIAAIKTLVGKVDIAAAQSNQNVFNEAVESAIGKILDHYELTFRPFAIHWQMGGIMQTQMVLVSKPKAEATEE